MVFSYFFLALLLSFCLTALARRVMQFYAIVDVPRVHKRKIHKKKIPLGGGIAIWLSFFLVLFYISQTTELLQENISNVRLLGLFLGSCVLMVGGFFDDKFSLSPIKQVWFPIIAAIIVILFGADLYAITNPFGGTFSLQHTTIIPYVSFANILIFFWLMGMMYTTKLLDGLDGLVTGIVCIGAFIIFFLSRQPQWYQPDVALIAIVLVGSCLGFLLWNWHPASIFLGEGGSLFLGFILGALAIISGGKIMTAILVMGIPILDLVRVFILRLRKKKSIFIGDSEHLHFKLLASGLTHVQTVLLFYSIAFLFGISTLFLQSKEKLIALSFLFVLMLLIGMWFSRNSKYEK